jgi:predicted nuclease of predicted toxin-antitoxin system
MKLLFDQNLSPKLVDRLADMFAGSTHVWRIGLDEAADQVVWEFARTNGFTIVTKDADYRDLGTLLGHPPLVLWLRVGNCTTAQVEALLRLHESTIKELPANPGVGILSLV